MDTLYFEAKFVKIGHIAFGRFKKLQSKHISFGG